MKTLILVIVLYQAANAVLADDKPVPFRSQTKACTDGLKAYIECRVKALDAPEESDAVKLCQETYYRCFHKNHCERGDAQ